MSRLRSNKLAAATAAGVGERGGRQARGSTKARDKLSPELCKTRPRPRNASPPVVSRGDKRVPGVGGGGGPPPRFRCAVRALHKWREKGFLSERRNFAAIPSPRRAVASMEILFFPDRGGGRRERGITQ